MAEGYIFKEHERPFMPGSPATPDHPARRRIFYILIGLYLALAGGLQNGLLLANLTNLQGSLALTPVEAGWVTVAYNMTSACMSIMLFKSRQHFGVQRFVRFCVAALLIANFIQLFDAGYHLELVSRGISGIAASGLSTLAIFYLMQGMPGKAKIVGMLLGVGLGQVALPLARALSPWLMESGDIHNLFILQFAMSMAAIALVNLLHLPPGETASSFEKLDLLSFPLLAGGMGLLCAFLVQGRIQWWSTPWLGYALAASIILIGLSFLIEHNRSNPMLHTRWMSSWNILAFALTGALVRVLLSEQNFGASGLLATVGMGNDQMVTYYWVLTGASLLGILLAVARLNPMDLQRPVIISFSIIAVAAFMDSDASSLTRPANLYWTQAALAFAAVYFMAPAMMEGLLRALAMGPAYIVSFMAVFGLSQTLGGLAGAAGLAAFHTMRTKAHLMAMGQELSISDPLVAQAIQMRAAAYAGTMGDAPLRQANGASLLVQQASREAMILAYNDVFFVIGVMATLIVILILPRWIYNKRRGINPLAKELATLATLRGGSKS